MEVPTSHKDCWSEDSRYFDPMSFGQVHGHWKEKCIHCNLCPVDIFLMGEHNKFLLHT